MKTTILNGKKVVLYDSIDEMPIANFQKYNKYLLIDAGIGSTVDDVDGHIVKIAKFIKSGDQKKSMQELQNLRQNLYMINESISPKFMSFASLVKSVDGREVTDLSDESLRGIISELSSEKHGVLYELFTWLKKKVSTELELYFPNSFTSGAEKDFYDKIKRRAMLLLDYIINNNEHAEALEEIDNFILSSMKPKSFSGKESVEIKYDKQYEDMCLLISQKLNISPYNMTVLQFYNAIDNIKKQIEAENKSIRRAKHGRR